MYTAILATLLGSAAYATQVSASTEKKRAPDLSTFGFKSITQGEKYGLYVQNFIRQKKRYPKGRLEKMLKKLQEGESPDKTPIKTTKEGLEEAINFIKNMPKAEPLKWSNALYRAAKEQCNKDPKAAGKLSERIKKYASAESTAQTILKFGKKKDAWNIILQLFVDDGDKDKVHRKRIVGTEFDSTALALCKPEGDKFEAIVAYGKGVKDNDSFKKELADAQAKAISDFNWWQQQTAIRVWKYQQKRKRKREAHARRVQAKEDEINKKQATINCLKKKIVDAVKAKSKMTPALEKAIKATAQTPAAAVCTDQTPDKPADVEQKPTTNDKDSSKKAAPKTTDSNNAQPVEKSNAAKCTDTEGWKNTSGFGCDTYAKRWCKDGRARGGQKWTLGRKWKYPERNCCVCGKKPPGSTSTISTADYEKIKTEAALLQTMIASAIM